MVLLIIIFLMRTDYSSGASVQQPPSPHTFQPRLDVHSQPLTFSKDMNNEQLAQWLRNHPSLTGTDYEEDISKLSGTCCTLISYYACNSNYYCNIYFKLDARINGHAFLSLNESWLERFQVSFGFQLTIMNIIEDTVY